MEIKQWMEAINYRVSGGSAYQWACYGDNAQFMDCEDEDGQASASVIFDRKTQEVYEASAYDYNTNKAYRWINPDYVEMQELEARSRGVSGKQAWDDVDYIDLDVIADILEKTTAIMAGVEYDDRVQMSVEFTDEEALRYMKAAHELDMTFNEFIEQALRHAISTRHPDLIHSSEC